MSSKQDPAARAVSVTPSDTAELSIPARALYIGGAGDVALQTVGGDDVTLVGLAVGDLIPVQVRLVKATGTTATNIVALG